MYQQTYTQQQFNDIPTISFIQPEQLDQQQNTNTINAKDAQIINLQQQLQALQSELTQAQQVSKQEPFQFTVEDKTNLPQICNGTSNRKTILSIVIAVIILAFVSTYSVNCVDKWLDNHQVDLFSQTDKMNELLLFMIQFLFIFVAVRLILNFL